jgi:hypothetical protein
MIIVKEVCIYINQIKEWYNENLGQDYHATITVDQVATCKEMLVSGVGVTIHIFIYIFHHDFRKNRNPYTTY